MANLATVSALKQKDSSGIYMVSHFCGKRNRFKCLCGEWMDDAESEGYVSWWKLDRRELKKSRT
jgi:hypothetical protein